MAYPHAYDGDWYTVGRYDAAINDWSFAGEYGTKDAADNCARKVADKHNTRVRVTNIKTGQVTYFEPSK